MSSRELRWVIDAIEENAAAIEVEGGTIIHIPRASVPAGAKPGDILRVTLELDIAATRQATADSAAQVRKGADASRKRDPGGDITL